MLDHVSITVDDIQAAETFYDAVMAALGVPKVNSSESSLGYGERCRADMPDLNYISVKRAARPEPAHSRHWCFKAPSRSAVDEFWQSGLANGGEDDGPPGVRAHYHAHYYAAFLIDPAGNRIEAVCHLRDD